MNLLLHGLDAPQIDSGNALRFKLSEIGEKDRVDVVLTNPPFGGEEEKGIQGNFPEDRQTAETALLFLQLIMRKLHRQSTSAKRPSRAAVVVPNGMLSASGVAQRLREDLLNQFNLYAVVRLPHNVFAPYTDLKTNLLFFERGGPTEAILYCEPVLPEGFILSKSKPLQYEYLAPLHALIRERKETVQSWLVRTSELDDRLNLDLKNPNLRLSDLSASGDIRYLADDLQSLAQEAEAITQELTEAAAAISASQKVLLGTLTRESDERIGSEYTPISRLVGVSAEDGITEPKTPVGKYPERYKVVREGYLAYNPMRVNIGSIGLVQNGSQEGITSPDYVVFSCLPGLSPEYVFYYLRSEAGRHAINHKTKGSVRFRLYYEQLASIEIPLPSDEKLQVRFAKACSRLDALSRKAAAVGVSGRRCLDAVTRRAFLGSDANSS
jgi:type I restriction enzyme M protein